MGLGLVSRGWLAQNAPPQRHGGVSTKHRGQGQAALAQAGQGGIQLQPGDALDIAARGLTGQHHLQGFGIFARSG